MGKNHANGKTFLEKRSVPANDLTFFATFSLSPHDMQIHVVYGVFVDDACNEISEVWQQMSCRPVIRRERTMACW